MEFFVIFVRLFVDEGFLARFHFALVRSNVQMEIHVLLQRSFAQELSITQFALIKFDFANGRIVMEHVLLVAVLIFGIERFAANRTEPRFGLLFSSLSDGGWCGAWRMDMVDV